MKWGEMRKFAVDFYCLWLEQMAEVRVNWSYYLLFSLLMPIILVFGFTRIGSGLNDEMSLLYIISGSVILSLASDAIYGMAVKIGEMKQDNSLMYYASLPISRLAFVLALVFSRFVVTIPGMIVPLVFGAFFYGFEVQLNLWLFLLIPLISISFAIWGLFIGILVENLSLINLVVNALLFLVLLAAPVFMPYESLPLPLQITSFLLPMTYAAAALRDATIGNLGDWFYINTLILLLSTVLSMIVLFRFWQWRSN